MEIFFPSDVKCIACAVPIPRSNSYALCADCFRSIRFRRDDERICTRYEGGIVSLIHAFKYRDKTHLAKPFARMLKQKMDYHGIGADLLTSIPSSRERMRRRGYNQSELLAQCLSDISGIPFCSLLERVKETRPLTGLDPLERALELAEAFKIQEEIPKIRGKKILIIDDILTTGATMREAADVIRRVQSEVEIDFLVLSGGRKERGGLWGDPDGGGKEDFR